MLLPDDFSRQKDERGEDEEKRFEITVGRKNTVNVRKDAEGEGR